MKTAVYIGPTEGFEAARNVLGEIAKVKNIKAQDAAVAKALENAEALLDASMKVRITDDMIKVASVLKIISCATTGSDHIQRQVLNERGIPVHTLKEAPDIIKNLTPAAELSWTLLMACARRMPAAIRHVIDGGWNRELFPGVMLKGKRLGLIGCGRIGGWMSRYGQAFGMEVVGYDPHLKIFPDNTQEVSLSELMRTSDFISIHVHLNSETEGLVSQTLIENIKPGAVLINTSRGAIVDEKALLYGLKSGRIHGVGLDVLVGEPEIADHPLVKYAREHDNVLITPHCGGFSPDAVCIVCAHAARKIRAALVDGDKN